jgi:RNA polymerase sigma-70 factor (ECF subfamily)
MVARSRAEAEHLCSIIRRAIARLCSADLSAARDDLVQSALLRVLEVEAAEAKPVRSTSYLMMVAFTTTASEIRRLRRRRALNVHEVAPADPERPLEVQAPEARPQAALAIRDCLERLAEPRRLAVQLHLQGFSAGEAGVVLGWSLKRVQNLVFRGVADLRQCLEKKGIWP